VNGHRYRRFAANRRGRGNRVRYDEHKAARWPFLSAVLISAELIGELNVGELIAVA